ncbi:hypothetical protein ARMSODRAFT_853360, partial [Armillaria solidipes]
EATCSMWCDAILKFSYEWIDHFVRNKGGSPPWTIPEFRFAETAIVQTIKGDHRGVTWTPHTWLVEEWLEGDFVKYVWNGNSNAYEALHEGEEMERAEFLMFVQHVQYEKLHRKVFISDFQGDQVMLRGISRVATGNTDMFGEGNVAHAFDGFPKDHHCNKWCEWFELEKYQ